MNNISRGLFWLHDVINGNMIETPLYNKESLTFPHSNPSEVAQIHALLEFRLTQIKPVKGLYLVHTRSAIHPRYYRGCSCSQQYYGDGMHHRDCKSLHKEQPK